MLKNFEQYRSIREVMVNETSVQPPHVLHTLLMVQTILKLAHWQTKNFPQHKALDEAYIAISEKADLLAEAYIGKYGDHARYMGQRLIGLMDHTNTDDVELSVQVMLASINECAARCLHPQSDSELINIIEEIRGELEKLKYLLSLKESIELNESTNDPNSFEVVNQV